MTSPSVVRRLDSMREVPARMMYGGHVKTAHDIADLQGLGLDFGELVFGGEENRRSWIDSGLVNRFESGFFLIAHAPREGPPNDPRSIREVYYPTLLDTVDSTACMGMQFLTIHLWLDKRFVKPDLLSLKTDLLRRLVSYAADCNVTIGLENLSESADDLEPVLEDVPGLMLTLDVGHAQLLTDENRAPAIIERLSGSIAHVHVHDNRGGMSAADDLHLPPGSGVVDFEGILGALVDAGYNGTITLELEPHELQSALRYVQHIIDG